MYGLALLAASETLSFVLAIVGGSFRLLARATLPLALLFILAACGGSTQPKAQATRAVHGPGFLFSVPAGWTSRRTAAVVLARKGAAAVSVTPFALVKRYDPARFQAAAKELDRIAAKLAARAGGSVTESTTTTVDGRKIRSYRYESRGAHLRIGFVLDGKREYQLLCTAPGSTDTDGACGLLFATFKIG
jgi:hypothetical protein